MGPVSGIVVFLYVVSCGGDLTLCRPEPITQATWADKPTCELARDVIVRRTQSSVFNGNRIVMGECRYGVVGGNKFRPDNWKAKTPRGLVLAEAAR